jgi:general L-amino acid transport system permease protein
MMARITNFLRRCVSSPLNAAVTVAIVFLFVNMLPRLFSWAILGAVWRGASPRACAGVDGACWLFIWSYGNEILYGNYPRPEQWRVILCAAAFVAFVVALILLWRRHRISTVLALTLSFPAFAGVLLSGGVLGLSPVPTTQWGGILLTAVIAIWTIASSLPLGLALTLARRSKRPVLSRLAVFYIDVVRGLPIVGILFLAVVLFPLFVPPGVEVNVLIRTLIAFSLFNAANMAEVLRGGIQAIPKEQYEGATALGLGYWKMTGLVIIPQTFRAALPGIINVSISIMKETTIVLMAGMFDFLGVLQNALIDPQWLIGDQIRQTAYFFVGLVFFIACFTLSRYSARIERRLGAGRPD